MANFGVSVTNNNLIDITISNTVVSIKDHSNYSDDTEEGHYQADFTDYKKIRITTPINTEYVFSTLGDGNELINTPDGETLPIETLYQSVGDGVYNVVLEAVPTYNNNARYDLSETDHVYYNGLLYKAIQENCYLKNPATEPTYWQVVQAEDLPIKYRLSQNFVVCCGLKRCFVQQGYNVSCLINLSCDKAFCEDINIKNWFKLDMILEHIPDLVANNEWERITYLVNLGKQICGCFNISSTNCNCN